MTEQRKVRWGVIGAGGIADRRTIPGMILAKNAELTAVMELNLSRARELREKYGAKYAFDSADELLRCAEIDAVYIATPVVCHWEQVRKAAAAKKHILIEKPVALTVAEGKKLLKICRDAGVLTASGFMMRYHGYHQKFRELVQSGRLGQIVSCRAQLTCWYPDMPGNWRQAVATSGGGSLMDMGIHCIDLLQYITGSRAKWIAAFADTKTFSYEVEDSASALFQLENGVNCYVDANFNIPDAAAECRMELYGTKGSILASGTISQVEGGSVRVILSDDSLAYDARQDRGGADAAGIAAKFSNMYQKEIESFSDSILNGTPVEVPMEDALQVQSVIESAYRSAKTKTFAAC